MHHEYLVRYTPTRSICLFYEETNKVKGLIPFFRPPCLLRFFLFASTKSQLVEQSRMETQRPQMPQFFCEALERMKVDPSTLLTILVRGSRVRESHSESSDWDVCAITAAQFRFVLSV